MSVRAATLRSAEDPVANVRKWTLLVAILTFAMLGWSTVATYRGAPPVPAKFLAPDGSTPIVRPPGALAPIGWPQLAAVYEHGLANARSQAFYDTTLFWQWMRMPGDTGFAAGALLMAWDFPVKLRPLVNRGTARSPRSITPLPQTREETP